MSRIEIKTEQKILLRDYLAKNQVEFSHPCGGNGRCGKCRVQFLDRAPEATEWDRRFFTEQQLAEGWRLGCKTEVKGDCSIDLPESGEGQIDAVADFSVTKDRSMGQAGITEEPAYGIAIDIGTTTLAFALLDLHTGEQLKTYTGINHQRKYGADVLSRIQKANEGHEEEMTEAIRQDLKEGVEHLSGDVPVTQIVIAGNTTMLHLLLGYSCEKLGRAPFIPEHLSPVRKRWQDDVIVTILPGISAFVGADIVSGIYALDMTEQKKPVLLLDLGTNGEMAVWTGEKLFVTSTAAGPAFEGGNLINGAASVPGAISKVTFDRGRLQVSTIGDATPIGVCGTGAISALAGLWQQGLIDENGILTDDYFYDGYPLWVQSQWNQIRLYQEDIRELQMAKGAIRAGMETLLQEAGVAVRDVERVYLAGGMGYALDAADAVTIGLLSESLMEKCEPVGNSSLGGCCRCLREQRAQESTLESIPEQILKSWNMITGAARIELANHPDFQEKYVQYLSFPENQR